MAMPVVLKSDFRKPTSTHNLPVALVTDMLYRSPALERRHNLALVSKLVHASISERLTLRHLARHAGILAHVCTSLGHMCAPGLDRSGYEPGAEGHGREFRVSALRS